MEDIEDLLYKIEEEINSGKKPLFGGGVTVDGDVIYELVDKIRSSLPEIIREAKYIVAVSEKKKQEDMLRAQRIIESAEQRRIEMLSESSITHQAEEEARAIREQANEYCSRLYGEVKIDVLRLFDDVEKVMTKSLQHIYDAKDRI